MPSPLAHIGAALALQAAVSPPTRALCVRIAGVAAVASVAPDLDIALAVALPDGLAWHRGPSHSVLGAIAIGLAIGAAARIRGAAAWVTVVGSAVLHVPFDWSTGDPGAPARYGVPWAWPFSTAKSIDSHPWFGAFDIDEAGFLAHMWSPKALPLYGRELATVATLGAAALALRWARGRWGRWSQRGRAPNV